MSEKMREAVAILADEMRSELTDDGASLPQWLVNSWVRLLDKALAEQPDREKYSTFANGENSVETHTASKQPAHGEPVAWRDHVERRIRTWRQSFVNTSGDQLSIDDFMDEESIDDLVDFVCDAYTAPPAPSVPDAWREVAEHLRYCRDCAESDISKCFDGAELWNRAASPEVKP